MAQDDIVTPDQSIPDTTPAATAFQTLSPAERKTFWASFGGYALDGMDFQLYGFVIPTLLTVWSMSRSEAGVIATVAILASAFGGWIGGIMADRFGRAITLQITIAWFSLFTGLSGLTNSPEQLMIMRALHGLGFGAEWAVGAALLSEIVSANHRGRLLGFVQSSWAVGWAAALISYTVTFHFLDDATAWRVLFFIGLAPALFIVFVRRHVRDSRVFVETRQHSEQGGIARLFSPEIVRTTLLTAVLGTGVHGGYYGVMIWLPTYLKTERNLSVLSTSGYLVVIILASFIGYISAALFLDRFGRRKTFLIFSAGATLTVILYTLVPISNSLMLVLGFPLGFFAAGVSSGCGAYFAELFPTAVRASGMGFAYNFGRAMGAVFPTLVGILSSHILLGAAIGIFTTCAYALIWCSLAFLPETKGRVIAAA
ncbi:MFS transporter [Pseudolabrys sp.]|uniref:MFS transporter n=1 Tax=Pseudolabrys sp. TaxID=1960880 RepID=UPI003D138B8C